MFPSYNHNVTYRGLTLHVQTEDAGAPRCTLVTHIFHTGDIIATTRSAYDASQAAQAPDQHIKAMQTQHQNAMRFLIHGDHDDTLTARGLILAPRA